VITGSHNLGHKASFNNADGSIRTAQLKFWLSAPVQ
jgi:hypothetical protein